MRPILSLTSNFAALAGVVLLGAAVATAYFGLRAVNETLRVERLSLRTVADLEGLQGSLNEAESLQREYLLTGDPALLARFETLRAKIGSYVADLESRFEQPEQRAAMPDLKSAIAAQLAALAQTMEARRSQGAEEAVRLAFAPAQTALTTRVDQLMDQFSRRERRTVGQRESAAAEDLGFLERGTLVGILLAVGLLGWSLRTGQRLEAARRAAESALQARSRELRLLIDAVPAMIAYVDTDERYLLHNRAYAQWLGIPSARIDGRTVREVVGEKAYALARPYIEHALAGDEARYERSQRHADGSARDLAVAYVPHRGAAGVVLGYYALLTDITDVKQLSRAKSDFVVMVSHELRTPATAIRGSLGLLEGGGAGPVPAPIAQLAAIAQGACERLLRVLDDILEIERIEAGEIALEWREEDLQALLAPSIAHAGPLAEKKGVRVESAGSMPSKRVRTDAGRVDQVLTNLLANAIQFSPDGGVVQVGAQAGKDHVRISVRDHGPGVSEDFRPRLFQKFSQAPGAARGRTGRFGLGLAVSKMLVERLGGRIGYDPAPGGGSIFWFELHVGQPGERRRRERDEPGEKPGTAVQQK